MPAFRLSIGKKVPVMAKLRLAIKKDGALQFLSHLDFARVVRLIIIRAALPVAYSEGFNPHMKINFASALGVGVSADTEYMDMELLEECAAADVVRRMNEQAPDGFAVLDGAYMDAKAPKLMAMANYAVYEVQGPLTRPVATAELTQLLATFNHLDSVTYEKVSPKSHKTRTINVKEHLIEPLQGRMEGERLFLRFAVLQTEKGAIKPLQVWELLAEKFSFPIDKELMLARRTALYHREKGVNYSLFSI